VRVWAPNAVRVRLQLADRVAEMTAAGDGWWTSDERLPDGTRYAFLLDDDPTPLPDPASRSQPEGVHEASEVYVRDFPWTDGDWTGRPLPGGIVYELHVGTFTAAATFDGAVERLDHLVELGVTHVELLPVNAVNGRQNWGYDGVAWYAVHAPYGGPDGLKRFVDAAHARGLAVVLDVVYNHLGPSGNYLPRFGPYLKTGRNTWGELVNLDGPGSPAVRRFILDNALMWLDEFHVDGLRLDAVHALQDETRPHLLAELSRDVDALATHLGRPLTLIAESDLNDPVMITPREAGGHGLDAQWDDDVHHALHALLTGERDGYYADFGTLPVLAKVLTSAFLHDGTYSSFRGREHGRPVDRRTTAGHRFVVCLQDHDQVGNRAAGERIDALTTTARHRLGALLMFTSPFTPMIWMGEEWAAGTPWPFFTSHPEPELGRQVAVGRVEEFARHGWDPATVPDPQNPSTYEAAVLDWSEPDRSGHHDMLETYRDLIALRRREPELADPRLDLIEVDVDQAADTVVVHRGSLRVIVNFGSEPLDVPFPVREVLWATTGPSEPLDTGAVRIAAGEGAVVRV